MSQIRLLVGTRKGAFILSADGARKQWAVSGPHFAGWEIYHLKGSPVDPDPTVCRFFGRCPRQVDRCRTEGPLLRTIGEAHEAACHFASA